jgi:hypothetical protein
MMVSVELVKFNTIPVILIEVVVFSEDSQEDRQIPQTHQIGDHSWTCIMFLIHLSFISSEIIQMTCPNLYLIYNFLFVQFSNVNYWEIISCSSYYIKWMVSDFIASKAFHDCIPDFCSCEYANKEYILILIR